MVKMTSAPSGIDEKLFITILYKKESTTYENYESRTTK